MNAIHGHQFLMKRELAKHVCLRRDIFNDIVRELLVDIC